LLLPTMAARLLQWVALVVAIEAVGAQVPLLLTVAIFALGRVLSLVPLTPGGAGITETVGAAALVALGVGAEASASAIDRKSTRLNSSHVSISYGVLCL